MHSMRFVGDRRFLPRGGDRLQHSFFNYDGDRFIKQRNLKELSVNPRAITYDPYGFNQEHEGTLIVIDYAHDTSTLNIRWVYAFHDLYVSADNVGRSWVNHAENS